MSDIKWRTGNPPCNGNYLVDTDDDICVDYWFECAWDDNKDKVNGWIPIEGDLVEQKHGYWLFYEEPDGYYHTECSECGQWCDEDVFLKGKWHYCPNCGAKMDEVEDASDVDVVEVVRCKDCIHYWKNKPSDDVPVCLASPKDDAFCSEGERKEDEIG